MRGFREKKGDIREIMYEVIKVAHGHADRGPFGYFPPGSGSCFGGGFQCEERECRGKVVGSERKKERVEQARIYRLRKSPRGPYCYYSLPGGGNCDLFRQVVKSCGDELSVS